jgi:ClpP class serine protease
MSDILNIIWIILLIQIFIPLFQKRFLAAKRLGIMRNIEKKRQSRVITMLHRQETMSLLGFPIARYIDIEDSEHLLRAIRMTPEEMPIDLVLHTPGGLVLASEQIACALKRHPGKVTVFVPHYAMSGGTLIALAADEIVMDPDAVLGPEDPQLGSSQTGYYPAASILKALETIPIEKIIPSSREISPGRPLLRSIRRFTLFFWNTRPLRGLRNWLKCSVRGAGHTTTPSTTMRRKRWGSRSAARCLRRSIN